MKKKVVKKPVKLARKKRDYMDYVFIGFAFLILIIIAFTVYFLTLPSREVSFCQDLATVNADLSVRYDVYYEYMNSNEFLTDCLMDLAIKRKDPGICKDLSSRFVGDDASVPVCYGAVYGNLRLCDERYSREDPTENITRTKCVAGVGYHIRDSSVCTDSHPNLLRSCVDLVAELTGDYGQCNFYKNLNLTDQGVSYMDECLFSVYRYGHRGGTQKSVFLDFNMCFLFEDENYYDSCFHSMAMRHRDLEICNFVKAEGRRLDCKQLPDRGWSLENSPYRTIN